MLRRSLFRTLALVIFLPAGLAAQTEPTPPAKAPAKKAKKVWGEEEVRGLKGGVSVVGGAGDDSSGFGNEMLNTAMAGLALGPLQNAAERGDADSQYELSRRLWLGAGMKQNRTEARKWLLKSGNQNYARAAFTLGVMAESGEGTDQNYAEAARWYVLAANQGHSRAQYRMAKLFYFGQGVPRSAAESARWLRESAGQGDSDAQLMLGVMYAEGEGVPADPVSAYVWLTLAGANEGQARDYWWKARDQLSADQLAEAKRKVEIWRSKFGK